MADQDLDAVSAAAEDVGPSVRAHVASDAIKLKEHIDDPTGVIIGTPVALKVAADAAIAASDVAEMKKKSGDGDSGV